MRLITGLIALFSVFSVAFLYLATVDTAKELSPQGCRMSYMYPSYVLQSDFDVTWTPLARRYSLWLYREVDGYGNGWEDTHVSAFPDAKARLTDGLSRSQKASPYCLYQETRGLRAKCAL